MEVIKAKQENVQQDKRRITTHALKKHDRCSDTEFAYPLSLNGQDLELITSAHQDLRKGDKIIVAVFKSR